MSVHIEGDEKLIRRLEKIAADVPEALAVGLYEEGFALEAEMIPRIPVDTGRLRSTSYVAPPTKEGSDVVVEVGTGTKYGVEVHERTEIPHVVGEAKFLENAFNARAPGFGQRLADRAEAAAERGQGAKPLASSSTRGSETPRVRRNRRRAPGRR